MTDAIENGVSRNLAFYALSILNAASVFGRIIPNVCCRWVDRLLPYLADLVDREFAVASGYLWTSDDSDTQLRFIGYPRLLIPTDVSISSGSRGILDFVWICERCL